jgi:hypothetical protein
MLPRFSLQLLLSIVIVVSLVLGVGTCEYQSYLAEEQLRRSLAESGCTVVEDDDHEIVLRWDLENWYRQTPNFDGRVFQLTVDDIDNINRLKGVIGISFRRTDLTDDLLERVRPFEGLRYLRLAGTKVTPQGIERMPSFPRLLVLDVAIEQLPPETESVVRSRFPGIQISRME